MFDPVVLFRKRLHTHFKRLNRYMRYVFNGHFMIALMFLIITLAIYYQRWLEEAPHNFPAAVVIGLVLAMVVTYNPLNFFLKEPDKVFLIVKENTMRRYFFYTFLYNYVVQLYLIALGIAVVMPLYRHYYSERELFYDLSIVIIILVLKIWNLNIQFLKMRYRDQLYAYLETFVRFLLHVALFYTLVSGEYFLVVGVITLVYYNVIYWREKKHTLLMWEKLIANDEQRLASFYRFVSMFADVPNVKSRLRRRRFLTALIQRLTPLQHEATYAYLYRLSFVRIGDYLPLFLRLTLLASFVIYFVPNEWFKLVLALVFVYLTSFQLIPLYTQHRMNIWPELYPVPVQQKEKAFLQFIKHLSWGQVVFLAFVFIVLGKVQLFIVFLLAGFIFTYLFVNQYVQKKIKGADVYE